MRRSRHWEPETARHSGIDDGGDMPEQVVGTYIAGAVVGREELQRVLAAWKNDSYGEVRSPVR